MPAIENPAALEVGELTLADIPRKRWTREEAHALVDQGFQNAEKWELIEGELIDKIGKKRPHIIWQSKVRHWLEEAFCWQRVESESPNNVAPNDNVRNEPEPDLKVLRNTAQTFTDNPLPEDILLMVEISDSTVRFDLKVKAPLYARAAISEYWVVDIPGNRLVVHRQPEGGQYKALFLTRQAKKLLLWLHPKPRSV